MEAHLGYLQLGALGNKDSRDICAQVFMWTQVFISLRQMTKSVIAGLYVKCMFTWIKTALFYATVAVPFDIPTSHV